MIQLPLSTISKVGDVHSFEILFNCDDGVMEEGEADSSGPTEEALRPAIFKTAFSNASLRGRFAKMGLDLIDIWELKNQLQFL